MSRSAIVALCLASLGTLFSPAPLDAQPKGQPPGLPPQYPTLTTPASLGVTTGTAAADLTLTGTNLTDATAVWTTAPGVKFTIPTGQTDATKLNVKVEAKETSAVGVFQIRVVTKHGSSNFRPFCLEVLPLVVEKEKEGNNKKESAQAIPVPCVVTGSVAPEASDFFKVPVRAGQSLTIEAIGRRIGSPLDPVILLHDAKSVRELPGLYADDTPGLQSDARVVHTFAADGEVIIEVRDTTYRGGADYTYRLRVGEFPGVTTAFPLAIQEGKKEKIGGSGPGGERVARVELKGTPPAVYFTPQIGEGITGWPVPVRVSSHPESSEKEPNNKPADANQVTVPGGVSARFAEKSDLDHFRFAGKKGQKLEIVARAYELNAPTEIFLRVLDGKGAELAKSNPMQPTARIEFTPPADADYTIAAEHLNYLHGPNEVYHLVVQPLVPDFEVALGQDRFDVAPGGASVLPVTGLTKLNGFNAAVELSVAGVEGLSGSLTIPAAANPTPQAPLYLPIALKAGAKPGPFVATVRATAKIDGKPVVKPATVSEIVRAGMSGLTNLPPEMTGLVVGVVTDAAPFDLAIEIEKPTAAAGGSAKGKLIVKRASGFDGEVALAAVAAPAGVTLKTKPVAKGAKEGEVELVVDAKAAVGSGPVIIRGTSKHKDREYAYVTVLPAFEVTAAAKKK